MGMREDEMVGWHHRHDGHEFVGSGCWWGFPCGSAGKESACNVGDLDSIPGLGRSPGEGKGCPLQYFGLENPRDRGAWWAAIYGVAQSRTRLRKLSTRLQHSRLSCPS